MLTFEKSIITTAKTTQTSESMHSDRTVTSRNDDGANEEEYPLSSRGIVIATITSTGPKRNYLV